MKRPTILFILSDDHGYGDVAYNLGSDTAEQHNMAELETTPEPDSQAFRDDLFPPEPEAGGANKPASSTKASPVDELRALLQAEARAAGSVPWRKPLVSSGPAAGDRENRE